MRWLLVLILLSGCSSPVPAELAEADQVARYRDCLATMRDWRSKGVWIAGGVKPAVDLDKFNSLTGGDRDAIAETAACIQANGQYGPPVNVEITEAPNRVLIARVIRAENVRWPERKSK